MSQSTEDKILSELMSDNPELLKKIKILAAIEDIKNSQKMYNKRFIFVTLALILIYLLLGGNDSIAMLGLMTFIFIFIPRFNFAGIGGFICFIFNMDSSMIFLGFYSGFILSSPNIWVYILRYYGMLKNRFNS